MALTVNSIAEKMLAQVDEQGHRHIIMDEIIDIYNTGTQVRKDDVFVTLRSGAKWRKDTTEGWQVLVQCKYGRTNWNELNNPKYSYLVHFSEYVIDNGYSYEPVFSWWIKFMAKKGDIILSKVKSKCWVITSQISHLGDIGC